MMQSLDRTGNLGTPKSTSFGLQWILGTLPVNDGDPQLWHRFDRNYNHAQFSPTNPNLVLFVEKFHSDPISDLWLPIVNRMWLIRQRETPRPVFSSPTVPTHECWDSDGRHVWCMDPFPSKEAWRTNIKNQTTERIRWPACCWQAHNGRDNDLLVCDSMEFFFRSCASPIYCLN